MVGDVLLPHAVDRIGLVTVMNELLDGSRQLDLLILFRCCAQEIQTSVCMRAQDDAANRALRPDILCNRLVQHGVAYEEMPLGNLRQRLAIPCVTQHRERRTIVSNCLTHAAPVNIFHLFNEVCRKINHHYLSAFSASVFFSRSSCQRF